MMTLLSWTSSANGQTTCEPPRICATEQLLEDAAERKAKNICSKALKKAARIDEYRDAAASARQREANCWGRLAQTQESPPPQKWQAPIWLKISLDFAIGGLAFGSGFAFADGAPDGVRWSLLTAEVGVLAGRIIVELFED